MRTLTKTLAAVAALGLVSTTAHAGSCGSKTDAASAGYGASKDLVQTAVDAGTFNTLAAALTEADLVTALRGDGPFTVFAPTDEAF
ncbi:MAG: fasciclin domain-containing protein, partial [Gemmatimonadetes bacterium]|nr:fasciclin domain-containing protein [Gemmatimonadota bacterium]